MENKVLSGIQTGQGRSNYHIQHLSSILIGSTFCGIVPEPVLCTYILFYPLHQLLEVKNEIHCRTDLAPSRLPFVLLSEETVREEDNLPRLVLISC